MAADSVALSSSPPPTFPDSLSMVEVRVIDTGTLVHLTPGVFWESKHASFGSLDAPVYSFLVSNNNRYVLFDLGVRADPTTYAPKTAKLIKDTTHVTSTGQDVRSIIESDASGLGIRATDVEAIIWSHNHFDHIGDPSRFPPTTELVVGPGVKSLSWPGYPSKIDGALLDSDAAGRPIREIQFSSTGLKVGGFDAFDYFGDGSFYLLDAPGHCKGHMCGLARTCVDPPSFILMAADACHHPGLLRPTAQLPLPGGSIQHPFLTLPKGPLMEDHETAQKTLSKIQALDALEDVFVILAHDASLRPHLPLFPISVNECKPRNIAQETKWLFCKGIDSSNI